MKFYIGTPVGNGLQSDSGDVIRVRKSLIRLGYEDKNPEYGFIDRTLRANIKSFQKDNGLKSDGILLPGGETETHIRMAMVRSPAIRCPKCGAPHGGSQGDICPDCVKK